MKLPPLLAAPNSAAELKQATDKALKRCRSGLRELARQEVAEALSELLDFDLTDLLLDAWSHWDQLLEAADKTRADRQLRLPVEVAEQTFTGHCEATLDVTVDGSPKAELPVRLEIELTVRALVATLRRGCITAVTSGECRVEVLLAVDGVALSTETLTLDLTVTVRPDPPIEIPSVLRLSDPPDREPERQPTANAAGSPLSSPLA